MSGVHVWGVHEVRGRDRALCAVYATREEAKLHALSDVPAAWARQAHGDYSLEVEDWLVDSLEEASKECPCAS
jgi:hypothetical protein